MELEDRRQGKELGSVEQLQAAARQKNIVLDEAGRLETMWVSSISS